MTAHDLVGYPLLAVSLVEILLGGALLRRGAGDRVRRAAAVLSFTLAAYSLSAGLAYASWTESPAVAAVFYRLAWVGWLGIPAGLRLLLALRGSRQIVGRVTVAALASFWAVALALVLATDLVDRVPTSLLPYRDGLAPLEAGFRLAGSLQLAGVVVVIWRVHGRSRGQERLQVAYLLLGLLVVACGGAVTAAVLPVLDEPLVDPALGSCFTLPWVLLMFVAITRHRLFDIATLLSRALGLVVLLVVFGGAQIAIFVALDGVLDPVGAVALSFAVTATVLLGTRLRTALQAGVDALVRRGRHRHHALLLESARTLVTLLEPEDVIQHLGRMVGTGLRAESVAVYAATEEATLLRRYTHGNQDANWPPALPGPLV